MKIMRLPTTFQIKKGPLSDILVSTQLNRLVKTVRNILPNFRKFERKIKITNVEIELPLTHPFIVFEPKRNLASSLLILNKSYMQKMIEIVRAINEIFPKRDD